MSDEKASWLIGVHALRLDTSDPEAARAFYSALTHRHRPKNADRSTQAPVALNVAS